MLFLYHNNETLQQTFSAFPLKQISLAFFSPIQPYADEHAPTTHLFHCVYVVCMYFFFPYPFYSFFSPANVLTFF